MANEIMNNEVNETMDTIETTIEVLPVNNHNGLKIAGGAAIAIGGLYAGYRFIVKPIIAKLKAKRGLQEVIIDDPAFDEEVARQTCDHE